MNTLEEFKEFIEGIKYEDIKRDRTEAEVCQEFNDIHKMLVLLYQCDFAIRPIGETISVVPLKLVK